MCGIAGRIAPEPTGAARLAEAARLLAHRGPDGEGIETVGKGPPFASLVHRRLAVIDLSEAAAQPMPDAMRRRWIVFNGEIYNYRELRRELEKIGHRFRTASDTEVILAAHAAWGESCVDRLGGMFAFAIWDDAGKRLFAARDRLGKKPFWYRLEPAGGFAFASHLRALLAISPAQRSVDPAALAQYLVYQYVPPPGSILRGISKLPPAHTLVWRDGRAGTRRYWRLADETRPAGADPREAAQTVRARLESAVRARLTADVPVGTFLSGGIDSTIVTALAARHAPGRLHTFSIGFDEKTHDETPFARLAAERYGTEHHAFRVRPEAISLLDELVDHYGEPFGDSSAIPTYYLSRETARHVKVVLSGDGGDELFLGYPRHKAALAATRQERFLPGALRRALGSDPFLALLPRGLAGSLANRLRRFLENLPHPTLARYRGWVGLFRTDELAGLLRPELATGAGRPEAFLESAFASLPETTDFPTRIGWLDLETYLPHDLLVKTDVAAMAHGLEVRAPFLDPSLCALAMGLPASLKIPGRGGKRILKEAFADLLPKEIRRRGKMGFGVPVAAWLREEGEWRALLSDLRSPARIERRGWFRPGAIERLVTDHLSGRCPNGYRLWALLFLDRWADRFLP